MAYADHFALADDLIAHLDTVLGAINDPFIESRYTGFVSVSAVTVLELALKDIFIAFGQAKHKVLGHYVSTQFERINGRIAVKAIHDDYLRAFGPKYQTRFAQRLEALDAEALATRKISIKSSYGNLIVWRNSFAHQGTVPANASYGEVKRAYACGKEVMNCLAHCMRR